MLPDVSTETWVPTVMLSFIEVDGESVLHQMWVTALGEMEWRPVENREVPHRKFPDCQVFIEDA